MNVKMEVWDKSEGNDLIIYKFELNYMTYLAEVDISTKRLSILRDYDRYMGDLPEDKLMVGEAEYNVAARYLRDNGYIA